ncbi:MAG: dihydroorotate dehydrogenase electron transfer subunit [Oscillospiraceae bacterium]|nr:dihydroorotate dehydrogenase electron transfer subunit [Oscillospiraceae bacterium]
MPLQNMCKITNIEKQCENTFLLTADMGDIAAGAKAGQFVHILCGEGNMLRRPISICDVQDSELTVIFEVKGSGTKWLSERAVGEYIDVLGPLGHGFKLDGLSNFVVVGGGIGVPPMLFAAKSAPCRANVTAVLGFRSRDRIILDNAFNRVCGSVITATDDGSNGVQGPVTLPLEELLKRGVYDGVLCCGPRPMLRAVAELCEKYSVPCQVSMEQRMGCGIGACLVCSCATRKNGVEHMSRVCKDGPVFDAREVIW